MTGRIYSRRGATLAERFSVRYEAIPFSGCWVWTGHVCTLGYGDMYAGKDRGQQRAHRVSWELTNGPIPAGMMVCHRCDVPLCVNPNHLFLGTARDNTRDMVAKGRAAVGERNGYRKLTDDDVRAIRATTLARAEVAKQFGIHVSAVGRIITGKRWAHVE